MFASIISAILSAALSVPMCATASDYFTDFASQQPELAYEVYENGDHLAGEACGTDACTSFETQGQRTFGNFAIFPSSNPGFYQNAATSQIAVGGDMVPTDAGPYSLTNGHSITMEAKIKFSSNYDLLGQSTAQGTAGLVFWNSAIGPGGQTPEYDQLGFQWTSQDVLSGFFGAGFTTTSLVDVFPVGISSPAEPIDLSSWFKVKMIWSQGGSGVQSVKYYADGQFVAEHVLPTQLHGLSLEIWNDNQEPFFCEAGFCPSYPNPTAEQNFYVDYVRITHN